MHDKIQYRDPDFEIIKAIYYIFCHSYVCTTHKRTRLLANVSHMTSLALVPHKFCL